MAKQNKKPGRPVAAGSSEDGRETLLLAARELFAAHGADAVSVRQVASLANVSPAMINYYFKDKRGLIRAVLERSLDQLLATIKEVVAVHDGPLGAVFIDRYIRTLTADPLLPQLMVREVLAGETSYRTEIASRFLQQAMGLLLPRLMEDKTENNLRSDLDPRLTVISLVSMCVFPFIARPLLGPALNFQYDEAFAETLIQHTSQLFYEGAISK